MTARETAFAAEVERVRREYEAGVAASSVEAPPPAPPEPKPEPVKGTSAVDGENEAPRQIVRAGRPTHLLTREDGSTEAVWPDGFEGAALAELPAGYWDSAELEALQSVKWAEVKAVRDRLEAGTAPTIAGVVQIDDRSKLKISGLVQMAQLAIAGEQPFEEHFTLADNQVAVLDAPTAIAMGVTVGRYVSAVHAAARGLRDRICAEGVTIEQLEALDVEAAFAAALEGASG